VVYGRLKAAHARRQIPQQRLLFPVPVEVGETAAAAAAHDVLGSLGFEVAPHAPGVVMLHALPEPLKGADPKPLLREVLGELSEGTPLAGGDLERVDHLLATVACHSVVRAGDLVERAEALALLAQLDEVDLRSHCPHGRPVMLRMPLTELERRFGRV
jgi:DNA mismatch repair protein MutL